MYLAVIVDWIEALKNWKRDVVERDYAESIIDGLDFEMPTVDDQFTELTNDFDLKTTGEGDKFDLSVDIGHNVYLQPRANNVASSKEVGSLLTTGSDQVVQNGSGLELMIIPITLILFFKSMMLALEKRGKSSGTLHARQWKEITA